MLSNLLKFRHFTILLFISRINRFLGRIIFILTSFHKLRLTPSIFTSNEDIWIKVVFCKNIRYFSYFCHYFPKSNNFYNSGQNTIYFHLFDRVGFGRPWNRTSPAHASDQRNHSNNLLKKMKFLAKIKEIFEFPRARTPA